jgi:hypothetical protein
LQYEFRYAVGTQSRAAHPDSVRPQPWVRWPEGGQTGAATALTAAHPSPWFATPVYTKKVKMQRKAAIKGGCG